MKCLICGQILKSYKSYPGHLTAKHNFTTKEYYDLYLKKPNEGICICGKPTRFINLSKGYKKYCSLKCATPHIKEQGLKTIQERYGVNNIAKIPSAKSKIKQTMLDKYGVEYFCTTEKCINAGHTKDALKKGSKTRQQTCLNKYGVDNVWKLKKNIEYTHSPEVLKRAHDTRKLNGWTRSYNEKYFKEFLDLHSINFKHNYKSNTYPWLVDFYLVDYDLYIELNIFWMHGGHWFDSNNEDDIKLLKYWKSKSKSTYYQDAIYVWTKSDIAKRDFAVKNYLNYVVLWNKLQINQFLADLESGKQFNGFIDYNCLQDL